MIISFWFYLMTITLAHTHLSGCFESLYQMKMIEAVFLLNTDDCFLLVDSHEHDDTQGIPRTPATTQSMVRILNAEFRCLLPFQLGQLSVECGFHLNCLWIKFYFLIVDTLKVQRTVCKIPKPNPMELEGTPGGEEGGRKTTSQSVSEAAIANRKVLPHSTHVSLSRSSPQTLSCEFSQRELDNPFQSRRLSMLSGGYDNSLNTSLSSHVSSDVFTEEHCTNGMKKYASLPLLDSIEGGLGMSRPTLAMPLSNPATSLERHKSEMELTLNGVHSKSKHSSSGRSNPIPSQTKISSNRTSPQVCSCQKRRDSGFESLFKTSPRVSRSEIENDFHYKNQEKSIANPRFYRAMYSYNSQEDGEVAFRKGDEVEVIQKSENGWWLVRTSEELGWGPSNFLQSLAYWSIHAWALVKEENECRRAFLYA